MSLQHHIQLQKGDVPRYVLMPGDPERVPVIGKFWDSYQELQCNREFRSAKGVCGQVELAACSTGIGGPSTDIAVVELAKIGADTFIRVGTCGALQEEIRPGDLIIHTGGIRLTGTVDAYVGREYPAVASYEVVMALIEAAEELRYPYHLGFTASVDSFYAGEAYPLPDGFETPARQSIVRDLERVRAVSFEMEAATMFALSTLFGHRAGSICTAGINRITDEPDTNPDSIDKACQTASRAVEILHRWDLAKKRKGKAHYYPGLEL